MKLLRNNSLARWIGVAATATVMLAGCTRDPFEDEGRRPSDLPRVEMTIGLALPQMIAASPAAAGTSNATEAADTRAANNAMEVSDTEAMTVSFGGANTAETKNVETASTSILTPSAFAATAATRAGETVPTVVEQLIRGLWIVQFDGTGSDSKLVACDYYNGDEIIEDRLVASVAEVSGTMRLYVVANVGETHFEGLSVGSTTLGAFEAMACEIAPMNITQAATLGLPMVGRYDGTLDDLQPEILLQRMVAKVTVTCTADVPASEKFLVRSSQMLSASTCAAYVAPAVPNGTSGLYPDAGQPENFTDVPARALTEGMQGVWYVPENLRGVVTSITSATDKTAAKAPKGSTAIEVAGYYVKDGTFYDALYRIYLGQNLTSDFNLVRNHVYTVSMTVKGMNVSDSRIESYEIEDLGANGTANCYMAPKAGTSYRFDATVMGNGATTPAFNAPAGGVSAPAITPTALNPVSVKVLWETGTEKGVQVPFVELVDGTLLFTTAGMRGANPTEGNALLGAFDSNGTLLWSWHIWSTRYDPETNYDSYASGYDVLQYNLGADVTSEEGTIGRFGLYYQWGRKDPFIGPVSVSGTTAAITSNDAGYVWNFSGITADNGSVSADPVTYTIQHPTTFIKGVSSNYDWIVGDRRDNLWGNPNATTVMPNPSIGEKSIYDPCPTGWRVAPQNTWMVFSATGQQTSNPDELNVSDTFNIGWNFYVEGWKTGSTSFYPASGYCDYLSGTYIGTSTYGFCWSSSPTTCASIYASYLHFSSTEVIPMNSYRRANGFPIRCVRDGNTHGATDTAINLSANGSANSYIVAKAGTDYKFNAKVMGNGATTAPYNAPSGGVSAPAIQPKTLAPASAKVLWETGSVKGGVIKSVSVEDGYVFFTTAGTKGAAVTEGNAVIGAFDKSGTLIWSWHIWSTSYDPNTSYDTYTNYAGKNYTIMQYNLGADATAQPGEVGLFGLLYQWGRKDPFIGAKSVDSGETLPTVTSNEDNYDWDFTNIKADNSSVSSDPIAYSIQHPTAFILGVAISDLNWIAGERIDNLWGNPNSNSTNPSPSDNFTIGSKSIYDPCPPGWRVPPQDTWTGFTKNGNNSENQEEWYVKNPNTLTSDVGYYFYMNKSTSGATTFYPAAGYRYHTTGAINAVSTRGHWWASSPDASNSTSSGLLYIESSIVGPLRKSTGRANGFSVRCCKE